MSVDAAAGWGYAHRTYAVVAGTSRRPGPHLASRRSNNPMAVTAQRRLETTSTRRFGSGRGPYAIPDLTEIQTKSYARFLQYDTPAR